MLPVPSDPGSTCARPEDFLEEMAVDHRIDAENNPILNGLQLRRFSNTFSSLNRHRNLASCPLAITHPLDILHDRIENFEIILMSIKTQRCIFLVMPRGGGIR